MGMPGTAANPVSDKRGDYCQDQQYGPSGLRHLGYWYGGRQVAFFDVFAPDVDPANWRTTR